MLLGRIGVTQVERFPREGKICRCGRGNLSGDFAVHVCDVWHGGFETKPIERRSWWKLIH